MADTLIRHSPLQADRLAQGPHASTCLAPFPPSCRFLFRGSELAAKIAGAVLGVELPMQTCRAHQAAERAALWLGPNEWLLLAPHDDKPGIASELSAALAAHAHALVDVSHRNTALRLHGSNAALVLSAGCPLDLHESHFPVGMCARTVLAKAEIVLWRTAPREFHLEIWRSFAPYVWDFLIEARTRL